MYKRIAHRKNKFMQRKYLKHFRKIFRKKYYTNLKEENLGHEYTVLPLNIIIHGLNICDKLNFSYQ